MCPRRGMGAWFYRGARRLVAHWIDFNAEEPLCRRLRPTAEGFVMRHPVHDRRVALCGHCRALLLAREALAKDKPLHTEFGVESKSAP